ncbi:Flagellar motor rotation protein MotB [hydrothermal vent metagenome]|uniref:Flagellar motor rotation protein MotB n=1 Tax=hydrothermal vent metagenome TaxID=652676 RepID=A0A3B0ZUV7_9ZZZZ
MTRKKRQEEHVNHERWLVSYADFITLLFAFFVVMYSISSVNDGKYRVLSDTLIAAFNTPPKSVIPINVGKTSTSNNLSPKDKVSLIELKPIKSNREKELDNIETSLNKSLKTLIKDKSVKVTQTENGISVEMDASIIYISGSSNIEIDAIPILQKIARILAPLKNSVEVEGHTDNIPIHNVFYPTNWELSAARAARVVNLFANSGVKPSRLMAIGFGEFRPIASNKTNQGRKKNRRVNVVIRNNKESNNLLDNLPKSNQN